jgi:hypothetical protein
MSHFIVFELPGFPLAGNRCFACPRPRQDKAQRHAAILSSADFGAHFTRDFVKKQAVHELKTKKKQSKNGMLRLEV